MLSPAADSARPALLARRRYTRQFRAGRSIIPGALVLAFSFAVAVFGLVVMLKGPKSKPGHCGTTAPLAASFTSNDPSRRCGK